MDVLFMATIEANRPRAIDLYDDAGHLIRRAHQIAVALFLEKMGRDVTPVQYAVLRMLHESPGLDQVTLAQRVALDTSTTAELAARLEAKGWIVREMLARRQRRLSLTPEGEALLMKLAPSIESMQEGLFEGMEDAEASELIRLLRKFVDLNNEQSRAPLRRAPMRRQGEGAEQAG
ncbi:MarR family winged helix-turn-helix transcriptional regulator [Paraburkholderia bannensis]|uniref:MarR family winged helix-turn-helix transcriptional regulator n=1 Tax=Paraburkholderia bannensis TaxID=765414 RepID=UPI002AB2C447|nr:MarR family transcriptional regulator [Paraburkholderia bannensis]